MRPAVELSKLNRVGDRFWPGKPQATESSQRCMHAGITAITELAVKERPDKSVAVLENNRS